MRSSCVSGGFNQRDDLALVSGALGGTLALIQPQRLRFQRFQWDSSDINCADFLQVLDVETNIVFLYFRQRATNFLSVNRQ